MEPTSTQHRPYIDPKTKEEEEGKGGGGLSDMHDLHEIQWTATDTMNRLQWIVKEAGNRTSTITIRVV